MRCFVVITRLAFVAHAHGKHHAASHARDLHLPADEVVDKVVDKVVDRLLDRVLKTWPLHSTELNNVSLAFIPWLMMRANDWAKRRPRAAAAGSAFIMCSAGDVTAQRLEFNDASRQDKEKKKKNKDKRCNQFDFDSVRMLAMGLFAAGFSVNFWIHWYELLDTTFGEGSLRAYTAKTAANNLIAIPFVELPTFYAFTSLLGGQDIGSAIRRFTETYSQTVQYSLMVWVPGNFLIFSGIPPHLRVPTCDVLEYCSATLMSLASNRIASDYDAERLVNPGTT